MHDYSSYIIEIPLIKNHFITEKNCEGNILHTQKNYHLSKHFCFKVKKKNTF